MKSSGCLPIVALAVFAIYTCLLNRSSVPTGLPAPTPTISPAVMSDFGLRNAGPAIMPAPPKQSGPDQPASSAATPQPKNTAFLPTPRLRPPGVNYLEPFDKSLSPGEIRLDGLLAAPIPDGSSDLQMRVLWVTLPGERRTVLIKPRTKMVDIFPSTTLKALHSFPTSLSVPDLSAGPYHVAAIGIQTTAGAPLSARYVDIEQTDSYDTALETSMQAKDVSANNVDPAPLVNLDQAQVTVGGQSETVNFVRANAGTYRIAVGIAHKTVGDTDSLSAIAQSYGAIAAINGSFFDCYDPGPVKMPDHALIAAGRLVSRGDVGTIIGETPDGQIRMDPAYDVVRWHEHDPLNTDLPIPPGSQDDIAFWARAVEALGCGPRLVANNAARQSPGVEGFTSSEVLSGVSVRSAVGITQNGSLILIVTHASLPQLAEIMLQLGCRDAMNLDGGASSGLWLRGQSIRTPGRLLSNALLIMAR